MEAHEIGETVSEAAHEQEEHHEGSDTNFRKRTAVFVGVLGMLMAIASLGGESSMKETINANIRASDTYSFYQARNIRQTSYQIAADTLEMTKTSPGLAPEARDALTKKIEDYRATVKRYESDPEKGEGKRELLAKANKYEEERDVAQRKDINFDFSRALYEIAIVLASVSIVAASRPILWLCALMAVVATVLSVNGYFLLFELPIH
jgi:hypothetical protein